MDVEAALTRLRELVDWDLSEDEAAEFQEVFKELDGWLSKGGFLPKDWASRAGSFEAGQ